MPEHRDDIPQANPIPDGAQPVDMERAYARYQFLLNQTRKTKGAYMHATAQVALDNSLPTKFALLNVLSTSVWLMPCEVVEELKKLNYRRSDSSVRRGLRRLLTFGFVVREERLGRKGRSAWRLTQSGFQYLNSPQAHQAGNKQTDSLRKRQKPSSPSVPTPGDVSVTANNPILPSTSGKPTFTQVVKDIISEFCLDQKAFSAHEVTVELRARVNAEKVSIDPKETGNVFVSDIQAHRPRIDHDEVKQAVGEVFRGGGMVGYDRLWNGAYLVYSPRPLLPAAPVDSTPYPADPPSDDSDPYTGDPTL